MAPAPHRAPNGDDLAAATYGLVPLQHSIQHPDPQTTVHLRAAAVASSFSGPIPPPAVLGEYDKVSPGFADRIVKMAEREMSHRHEIERRVLDVGAKEVLRGQSFAFLIFIATLAGGIYTAALGHGTAGALLGVSGLTTIVTAFIMGRVRREKAESQVKTR